MRRQSGFTLLEVLAAFVIFAVGFVVLLEVISGGIRTTSLSEQYSQAVLLAESKLSEAGLEEPLEPGLEEGDFDDTFHWALDVQPYEETDVADPESVSGDLLALTLTVTWSAGRKDRSTRLRTLRFVPQAN